MPALDSKVLIDLHKRQAHRWLISAGCSCKHYDTCWNAEDRLLCKWVGNEESKGKVLEIRSCLSGIFKNLSGYQPTKEKKPIYIWIRIRILCIWNAKHVNNNKMLIQCPVFLVSCFTGSVNWDFFFFLIHYLLIWLASGSHTF